MHNEKHNRNTISLRQAWQRLGSEAERLCHSSHVDEISCRETNCGIIFLFTEDVVSNRNVPEKRTSIMDGWAATEAEGLTRWVNTGSTLTESERVIPLEYFSHPDSFVLSSVEFLDKYQHFPMQTWVREIGSDLLKGEVIIKKGEMMTDRNRGTLLPLMRAAGLDTFFGSRCDLFGVAQFLSTGDEILSGDVVDINGPLLKQIWKNSTWLSCPTEGELHSDEDITDSMSMRLFGVERNENQSEVKVCDMASPKKNVIISTGGVSKGRSDYVFSSVKATRGIVFDSIAIKPGKPTVFAVHPSSGNLWFGLPGNPCSAFVTMHMLVIPFMKLCLCTQIFPADVGPQERMMRCLPRWTWQPLPEGVPKSDRSEFLRASYGNLGKTCQFELYSNQRSSAFMSTQCPLLVYRELGTESGNLVPVFDVQSNMDWLNPLVSPAEYPISVELEP